MNMKEQIIVKVNKNFKERLLEASERVGLTMSEIVRNKVYEFMESVDKKEEVKED